MTVDPVDELKLLREVIAAAVNHLAAGGHIVRNDQLFKDLRKVHRATRDLQKSIAPAETAEHWRNIASNMAFYAGTLLDQLHGPWNVVLSSFLDQGATEMTALARTLAHQLGIELRESSDGGKTWYPIGAVEAKLRDASDVELLGELISRGSKLPDDRVRGDPPAVYTNPHLGRWLREQVRRNAFGSTGTGNPTRDETLDAIDVDATIEAYAHALGVPNRLITRRTPLPRPVFDGMCSFRYPGGGRCNRDAEPNRSRCLDHPETSVMHRAHRDYWEHRCDAGDRLITLDRGVQCNRCGEQDPVFMRSSAPAVK